MHIVGAHPGQAYVLATLDADIDKETCDRLRARLRGLGAALLVVLGNAGDDDATRAVLLQADDEPRVGTLAPLVSALVEPAPSVVVVDGDGHVRARHALPDGHA